jgi:hypothetical protein
MLPFEFRVNELISKRLYIHYTISSTTVRFYSVEAVLSHSSIVSNLGILTDNRLLFRDLFNYIVAKSPQRSGAIFRGFVSRDYDFSYAQGFHHLYVRPVNCGICNQSDKHLTDTIENFQRRYTKRTLYLSSLSYHKRNVALNLDTLELRRHAVDLTASYNILNNSTPLIWDSYFNLYIPPLSSRTHLPT